MFDIDGTLIESADFDSECFTEAVKEVTGFDIDTDWSRYEHVTDAGILNEFFLEKDIQNTNIVAKNVKTVFLSKIQTRIEQESIHEITGASAFIATLKRLDGVVISFATGGWYESAVLKLNSAGIDVSAIPIASSNDHYSRIEIMKIAEKRATKKVKFAFTYFGDGSWDLNACKELGVIFVLVGDKIEHAQSIKSFEDKNVALEYIGLM
jgi:phosphoglycolate phosphatase-like HAD superfamily hydrolase